MLHPYDFQNRVFVDYDQYENTYTITGCGFEFVADFWIVKAPIPELGLMQAGIHLWGMASRKIGDIGQFPIAIKVTSTDRQSIDRLETLFYKELAKHWQMDLTHAKIMDAIDIGVLTEGGIHTDFDI